MAMMELARHVRADVEQTRLVFLKVETALRDENDLPSHASLTAAAKAQRLPPLDGFIQPSSFQASIRMTDQAGRQVDSLRASSSGRESNERNMKGIHRRLTRSGSLIHSFDPSEERGS